MPDSRIGINLFYNVQALDQSTFGSIVGTVKDASGDVVNGASVVLKLAKPSQLRAAEHGRGYERVWNAYWPPNREGAGPRAMQITARLSI